MAAASPPELDSESAAILAEDDPALLEQMQAKYQRVLDAAWPKPELSDVQDFYTDQRSLTTDWRLNALREIERRYQQDRTPDKWQRNLEDGRRIFSRLTHNELNRVVSSQTRNSPKVNVQPAGNTEDDRKGAKKETRWANQFLTYVERGSNKPVRRRVVDGQNEIGLAGWEVYLTEAYDDLDTAPRQTMDAKSQTYREETAREVLKRTEKGLVGKRPIGCRFVHGLCLFLEEDDEGVTRALIVEKKPRRQVMQGLLKKGKSADIIARLETPKVSDPGWPDDWAGIGDSDDPDTNGALAINGGLGVPSSNSCITMRYYDRRWFAYIVDGAFVEDPEEHKLPGVPVFPLYGMVTSNPNPGNGVQGICAGMDSLERAINDLLTLAADVQFTYNRPRWAIETDQGHSLMTEPDPSGGPNRTRPVRLDLMGKGVPQLNPGQRLVNVMKDFEPFLSMPLLQQLSNLWQKSARNPVAQGESPGAAPAGYTVSALTGNAEELYVDNVRNEAVTWGRVIDFVRLMIRDTIQERVYLSAPVEDQQKGGTEWLGLGPDDVSETPCIVTIDPTSEANRMAKRQSLIEGNKGGYTPRRIVQELGYDADDPAAWDAEIALDGGKQIIDQWAVQTAIQELMSENQPPQVPPPPGQPGMPGAPGAPTDPAAMQQAGGLPAPPNPPTVGAGLAAASKTGPMQGSPLNHSTAMAGQPSNYTPPNVRQ